jgi:hypothetical protein
MVTYGLRNHRTKYNFLARSTYVINFISSSGTSLYMVIERKTQQCKASEASFGTRDRDGNDPPGDFHKQGIQTLIARVDVSRVPNEASLIKRRPSYALSGSPS